MKVIQILFCNTYNLLESTVELFPSNKKFDDGKGFLRCSPEIATEIHTDQRRIQDFPGRGRQRLNLGQKPIICKIFFQRLHEKVK